MKLGVQKLEKYFKSAKTNAFNFSAVIGVYPSTICRIMSGANSPDVKTAVAIEKHTNGAVMVTDWLKDVKTKP